MHANTFARTHIQAYIINMHVYTDLYMRVRIYVGAVHLRMMHACKHVRAHSRIYIYIYVRCYTNVLN